MKKLFILTILGSLALSSCSDLDLDGAQAQQIKENAEEVFGIIDPNHNWDMTTTGSITITADAPLDDIVKIQILNESPFGNEDAVVLNEANTKKGDVVTLSYDAEKISTQLVAACVSSKGSYYIRLFNIGDESVNFSSNSAKAKTRATTTTYPNPSSIILGAPIKSFNALRAEASKGSQYGTFKVGDNPQSGGTSRYYTCWSDGTWANDRLWSVNSVSDETWTLKNGTIYKAADPISSEEENTLKSIINTYLKKTGAAKKTDGTNKSNNWEKIAQSSSIFNIYNNYLTSDGNPLSLVQLQMNTTEGSFNSIYYYYFDPSKSIGMSEEEEINFIKALPKFKAIPGENGDDKIRREKEYLLPYYGDSPTAGGSAVSISIPAGYRIGFLNRKDFKVNNNPNNCGSGCIYGDGRLNYAVNHLIGHYFSAMAKTIKQQVYSDSTATKSADINGKTPDGMDWTSPRIGFFTANEKTFMCFEDGADCNFTDMIIEVCQGADVIIDQPEVPNATYTMCFEDRLSEADYDMNDVVIRCRRVDDGMSLSLVAAGGNDDVVLQGTGIPEFDGKEVHAIFHATQPDEKGNRFVNTENEEDTRDPVTYYITLPKTVSIPQYLKDIYIVNQSTGMTVRIPSKVGEPPYAIIIPSIFKYPREGKRISNAYSTFIGWAQNINIMGDWYKYDQSKLVFPNIFK